MSKLSSRDKLSRARVDLFKERPFYGNLIMYLKLKEDKEAITLNVSPNGTVRYNPNFIDKVNSKKEVTFYLLHELGHFITSTVGQERMNGRDKMVSVELPDGAEVDVEKTPNVYKKDGKLYAIYSLWNVAADYAVNDILKQDGFFVPEDSQTPDEYRNKSTEENYALLDQEIPESDDPPPIGNGFKKTDQHNDDGQGGSNSGGNDDNNDGNLSREELKERAKARKEKWKSRIVKAAEQAQRQGDYPGQLKSIVDKLVNPTLDWRSLLNQYISQDIVRDVSFRRPHKKSYTIGAYLPNVERENLDVTVAIDTSGSISDKLLADFLGEVQGIKNSHTSVEMDIILADAEIQDIITFRDGENVEPGDIELLGRGGTDHRPVFEWVNKNKNGNRILVCLTDGYTSFPERPPMYDVIWAVTPNGISINDFPFGEVVQVGDHRD